jgi:hypothetical protein
MPITNHRTRADEISTFRVFLCGDHRIRTIRLSVRADHHGRPGLIRA